jgi:uncharacterized protein YegL
MRNDYADVTLVVDRSGTMVSCRLEAENGVNHYIDQQKKHPGKCVFSLVQFDSEYEFVHRGVPVQDVPPYKLYPRGMTALLDAVGRAINETGERLAAMPEEERPALVVFVIVTDGLENASHEFTKEQIRKMIECQQKVYSWQFTYLGANQDAFAEAGGLGITRDATANYSTANSLMAFNAAGAMTGRMRSASMSGETVTCCYIDEERESME